MCHETLRTKAILQTFMKVTNVPELLYFDSAAVQNPESSQRSLYLQVKNPEIIHF